MPEITDWIASPSFDNTSTDSPLIVLLHGYGSNERDLPGIANWLGLDWPWVSLRAPESLTQGGFAWFPITTPLNPSAEDVAGPTRALWSWIDENVSPEAPLVVIGFSQGGLMATQLLRTRPARIQSTAVLAGFVAGASQIGDTDLLLAKPLVFWAHGDSDTVVSVDAVERAREFLTTHTTVAERVYPGLGHSVDERVLDDLRGYLLRETRSPARVD